MLSTALGICAARAAARFRFPGQRPIMGLIMLPLVLPTIIFAVSLLIVLVQLDLGLSLWTVVLGAEFRRPQRTRRVRRRVVKI